MAANATEQATTTGAHRNRTSLVSMDLPRRQPRTTLAAPSPRQDGPVGRGSPPFGLRSREATSPIDTPERADDQFRDVRSPTLPRNTARAQMVPHLLQVDRPATDTQGKRDLPDRLQVSISIRTALALNRGLNLRRFSA